MSTMREALRQAAEDYKGIAAVGGAFMAGGLAVSVLSGAVTQPHENAEEIAGVQQDLSQAVEQQAQMNAALRDQVAAVVTFVETQALFNCTLLARVLDDIPVTTCREMPGVPRGAGPGG